MRTQQKFMGTIHDFAKLHEKIRVVTIEGSRTNVNVPKDEFQDFDITFFVTDMNSFLSNDEWLACFGKILILQKPENMVLFPSEEEGFSYLMMFDDYLKMDLTLLPLEEWNEYLLREPLAEILLDKDGIVKVNVVPSDESFHVKKPTEREFDDCCNEFWFVTTYVVKGLCRKEILFANHHMDQILRRELLRMISWKVGIETNFSLSVGKHYKYLDQYVSKELWDKLLSTYVIDSYENVWKSLLTCNELFRRVSREVAEKLKFFYPDYDRNVSGYVKDMEQ